MEDHTATNSANREGSNDDDKKQIFYKYWIKEEESYGNQDQDSEGLSDEDDVYGADHVDDEFSIPQLD
ncbi:hypothetical protein Tco_0520297 [Tanacetum coccineum]